MVICLLVCLCEHTPLTIHGSLVHSNQLPSSYVTSWTGVLLNSPFLRFLHQWDKVLICLVPLLVLPVPLCDIEKPSTHLPVPLVPLWVPLVPLWVSFGSTLSSTGSTLCYWKAKYSFGGSTLWYWKAKYSFSGSTLCSTGSTLGSTGSTLWYWKAKYSLVGRLYGSPPVTLWNRTLIEPVTLWNRTLIERLLETRKIRHSALPMLSRLEWALPNPCSYDNARFQATLLHVTGE